MSERESTDWADELLLKAKDKSPKPTDKLADYRDQRMNYRDGIGSFEPEYV